MMIPISGLNWFILGLIILATGFKFRRDYLKHQADDPILSYFVWFFICTGSFLIVMALPHIVLLKPEIKQLFPYFMAWSYIDGHMVLYLSFVFISLAAWQLYLTRFKKTVIYFYLGGGFLVSLANILFFSPAGFDSLTGITLLNTSAVTRIIVPIFVVLAYVPTALIFLFSGYLARREDRRIWPFLLFIGLILITVGGPIHDFAKTPVTSILADSLLLVGFMTIAAGIIYRYEKDSRLKAKTDQAVG